MAPDDRLALDDHRGFYLLAYLFWYIPALAELPRSVRDPPGQFPWHWPLDFAATGVAGGVLLLLGFRRATEFADSSARLADDEFTVVGARETPETSGRGSGDR